MRMTSVNVQDNKHTYECPNFEGTLSKIDVDNIKNNAIQLAEKI